MTVHIPAMDCSAEESEIRRALGKVDGIRSLQFRLAQRTLLVNADPGVFPAALAAIRKAGFDARPAASTPQPAGPVDACRGGCHPAAVPVADGKMHTGNLPHGLPALLGALALAAAAEVVHFLAPQTPLWHGGGMVLACVAIALSGFSTYRKGLAALRHGRLNINALMTVAVSGAFLIGQWPEAAMVMALYALAEWIEARSVDRARHAIQRLLALAPAQADVQQADGSWQATPVAQIAPGTLLRIKPGERIALDGIITEGSSAMDQSPVTGESVPVDKTAGDAVYAGTINTYGLLQIRSTASSQDTTLARIIHAVEQAQDSRAPTQALVDRFAAIYTPAVFVLACAVALLGPWLMGWPWLQATYKALVLLVIACPCALVIATPVTVVSALAAAARRGILIKGGTHLEQARTLRTVAFDKTGTLTSGKPRLVATEMLIPAAEGATSLLSLAATLSGHSSHPVSQAIAGGLHTQGVLPDQDALQDFVDTPGQGVQARVKGRYIRLGNATWLQAHGPLPPALQERIADHQHRGHTVSLLADGPRALILFAVADTVKDHASEAVATLHGLGVDTLMLSGDHPTTASAIAMQAGVPRAHGGLLPQDKLQAIADSRRHGPTAMVGDGINDAPALASADIGFAMGGAGTDIAMEAADIVIMNDDLRRIPETVRLSRHTHRVLWQNIVIALGIKGVFFMLAVLGDASMWMAVFADMGASLLVVANGLRLLRWKAPPDAVNRPAHAAVAA